MTNLDRSLDSGLDAEPDQGRPGSGGAEVRSMPFFPAQLGAKTATLSAPAHAGVPPVSAPAAEAVVKGRITIDDEVIEKIAALAAREVTGVAGLSRRQDGGDRRGGVQVRIQDNEAALDLYLVVEYGNVIMEVAKAVKSNVARVVSLMVGMRVTAVNVTIEDVRMTGDTRTGDTWTGGARPAAGPQAEASASS